MKSEVKVIPNDSQNNYFNREISWLHFNRRVLQEAQSETTPILEKLKFLAITYSNLDEFFMVRVAGKRRAAKERLFTGDSPDSTPYGEILTQIREISTQLLNDLYDTYHQVVKELGEFGVQIRTYEDLDKAEIAKLEDYYHSSVHPTLTPLAVDPAHPFPFLTNLGLYLLIEFKTQGVEPEMPAIAFVEIPHVLERFVNIRDFHYILLEDVVAKHLEKLFWGLEIKDIYQVRVTRDLDYSLLENEVVDLLQSVQNQVRAREQAKAVKLEVSENLPNHILDFVLKHLKLGREDVYFARGPLSMKDYFSLSSLPFESLKFDAFNPRIPPQLKNNRNIFSIIKDADILLHHPFESFYTVIEFLRKAATDPEVLAIKQTLYRTSGDSPIIDSLIEAAENGKQVTAVVELKARFDEKNNIIWARQLERSGVNVVYGFIGLKTHAKATLVIRREDRGIKRYVHLSTGNYNSTTAKIYTDIGLMSADDDIGHDISDLFNLLTGFNLFTTDHSYRAAVYPTFRRIMAAPVDLRDKVIDMVDREIENVRQGGKGFIMIKANALVDKAVIDKFYEASQAGVSIRLLIRGICCLKPGHPGLSESIEVRSVVDRFLEHSRIYYFHNNGENDTFLSSADLMPRNMDRRIEIMFPILNDLAKARIINEVLEVYWQDNTKARRLLPDGNYEFVPLEKSAKKVHSQQKLIELAREQGLKSLPYEKAIWHNTKGRGRPIAKRESKSVLKLKGKRHKNDSKEHKS
ncbi:polyphosphate kinase 1 [Pseudobacteriovorax antillogorgiicola]|uniref:Polyphosphate kinase n=1 Tax=Pseudobacteriovorax antillogorgiicola TaxID=1513793 RepID=A0A1Y6B7K7_9BACT|nr:polyphosphate kinase 1 [Pseudobacteriovorax antillogorgiicola]TCS59328.1 polyphosphate kinase [Pseudobacteriovorax antillogorgiicola]SME89318.1 polyphosphate kinase [Pseudobacteriovorax antillogorgiicola]